MRDDLTPEQERMFQEMWGVAHHIADRLDRPRTVEELLELQRLEGVLTRFTYYYDGADTARLATLFHSDVRLVNPRGTYRGVDAVIANYAYLLAQPTLRFHGAANVSATVDDDGTTAWLFGYLLSVGAGPTAWTGVTGTYTVHLLKVDDRWLIRNLRMTANIQTHDGRLSPNQPRPPQPDEATNVTDWLGPRWVR